mmetsp:Transcript_74145/g.197698  ORF Transcript_74145/g.197698 Transcript_74145/m.197698 type:complete len:486 (-) Transcript_74145:25-1482(-)
MKGKGRIRWPLALIVLFVRCGAIHESSLYKDSADVIEVEEDTFDHFIAKGNVVMKFYAHWCPHCVSIVNLVQQQARNFKGDPTVKFAALDCAVFGSVCERFGIRSYPSIRFFTSNVSAPPLDFPRERGYSDLAAWVTEEMAKSGGTSGSAEAVSSSRSPPSSSEPSVALAAGQVTTVASPWAVEQSQPIGRLWDALLAFLYSLRQTTTLFSGPDSRLRDSDAYPELMRVLGAMARSLPSAEARVAVKDLREQLAEASPRLTHKEFEVILDGIALGPVRGAYSREPEPHWRHCATYTCGLWSLFHILMLSAGQVYPAPQVAAGFMAGEPPTEACAAEEVSETMRTFVDQFFPCAECRGHFLKMWEADSSKPNATTNRYDGVMWLWSTHNVVNTRLWQDRAADARWPSFESCTHCRANHEVTGEFIPSLVYQHLVHSYWSSEYATVDKRASYNWLFVVVGMFAIGSLLYMCVSGSMRSGSGSGRKSA